MDDTWITLMGSVGLTAAALGILAAPAVLSDLAHGASPSGGYHYAAAWDSLYDGSNAGLLSGLEVTCSLAAAALLAVLAFRPVAAGRARPWMLSGALVAAAVALGTNKFPTDVSDGWGRMVFETGVWMLHLGGGAIWLGGLAAELLLVMTVLFVAPFLHGSARNQAFQDNAAAHAASATAELPKIPAKQVSASTWAWGATETAVVIAVMIAGYGVSGRIARARTTAVVTTVASRDPDDLVGA
jgi:hypothetical protein